MNNSKSKIQKMCSVCGTDSTLSKVCFCSAYGDYLCSRHYFQFTRQGKFYTSRREPNKYIFYSDRCEIELLNNKKEIVGYAIIDLDDVEKCKKYKWYAYKSNNTMYAKTSTPENRNKKIFLHRYILNYNGTNPIDHINRNGLDNRKSNLRITTTTINNLNKLASGSKKINFGYESRFVADGVFYRLGYYQTKIEATNVAQVCKEKYIKNKGEFLDEYNLILQIDSENNPDRCITKTKSGTFSVKTTVNKRVLHIGNYKTIEEARLARDSFEHKVKDHPNGRKGIAEEMWAEKAFKKRTSGISKTSNNRWKTTARNKEKTVYIGTYDTLEEAIASRANYISEHKNID